MENNRIVQLASRPEALEQTVDFVAQKLARFLKKGERVLICFEDKPASLGSVFVKAVEACGAKPMVWGPDHRWKTLLRLTFLYKISAVIAPPLVVLGLTKLARAKSTPLYIHNVVTAGYPCLDWMINGIVNGLDCKVWGFLDWHYTNVVAGFSCENEGVHIRDDVYGVAILDKNGDVVPAGQRGEMYLFCKEDPDVLYPMMDYGRLEEGCSCGDAAPRLVDFLPGPGLEEQFLHMGQHIMRWSSVLDCRIRKGESGLEVEIIAFPGEKLPKLPSCAKLVIRPWDPETDEPFLQMPSWKNTELSGKKH